MNPTTFPEANVSIAENQDQYGTLPSHLDPSDLKGIATFCWQLTEEEKQSILETGEIWHQVHTFHQPLQPQLLLTTKPHLAPPSEGPPINGRIREPREMQLLLGGCVLQDAVKTLLKDSPLSVCTDEELERAIELNPYKGTKETATAIINARRALELTGSLFPAQTPAE